MSVPLLSAEKSCIINRNRKETQNEVSYYQRSGSQGRNHCKRDSRPCQRETKRCLRTCYWLQPDQDLSESYRVSKKGKH